MPEIDWTQVLIAIIVLVMPSVLRELRAFYQSWALEQPDLVYKLEQAADFGVKAAQVMKQNGAWSDEKGKQAEAYAVGVAQEFLNHSGLKIDAALILNAVKAAWLDYAENGKESPLG